MIYKVAPTHGKKNPLVYISICSIFGAISVMAIKAFGIALKLTFAGNNQFTHPSTYAFMIISAGCIMTQMTYFNKALSQFSTSIVNPLYYVTFTTATLCASFTLFSGFNTTDAVNTISLLCGFLTIFAGVYLLNLSRSDPNGQKLGASKEPEFEGIPTDPIAGLQTRRSMQARRSMEFHHRRSSSLTFSPGGIRNLTAESAGLMHNYDVEQHAFGLSDLVEDPAEQSEETSHINGSANGRGSTKGIQVKVPRKA